MTLLKPLQHESMLLPFEQFHIQSLYQAGKLIPEQCSNDPNPLFQLAFSHPPHTLHKTESVKQYPANRTHNPQLHTTPTTWKPQVCTSLLHVHTPVHHFRIHTVTPYKRDTWPTDRNHQALPCKKTYQEHPHTAPMTLGTPYNKPRYHTTLNTENTNST